MATRVFLFLLGSLFFCINTAGADAGRWMSNSSLVHFKGPKTFGVYVEGKFNQSMGESFSLCGIPMQFRISYRSSFYRYVNNRLKTRMTNVKVVGNILHNSRYGWYFDVENVLSLAESDKVFFTTRIDRYKNNPTHLYDLAFQAKAFARVCRDSRYLVYYKKASRRAIQAELTAMESTEYDKRYKIAQELEKNYRMLKFAFKVYRQCWNLRKTNRALAVKLAELGGKFYQGKWLLDEEIKKLSGLAVTKTGKWMVQEELLFKNFIEKYKKGVLPSIKGKGTFSVLKVKIPFGSPPKEVARRLSRLPQHVWRTYRGKTRYDQWIFQYWSPLLKEMASYHLFFLKGHLVDLKVNREKRLVK